MLKKGITIVVMLAMAICLFGSKPKATKAATELLSPEKMFEIQKNACLAHEELMKSFECNGGIYFYPDDFAGDYIDSGTLYVMSISKEKLNEYKDLLKDYDSVKYEVVTYSYNELMSKALDVSARYSKKYKIIETEVDVKKNRGKIFVTPKDYNDIKKELKNEASDVIVDWTYEATDEASIIAGSTLNNSITLAGSGTYNGHTAFITCGHSLSNGSSVTCGGSTIGTVEVNVDYAYSTGDYSIIQAASGYTATSGVLTSSGNMTNFTGAYYSPAVGTYLYKYGRVSGQAYCVVSATGVISSDYRYGLTRATLISGTSTGGDSGGPYRAGTDFCGIHRASNIGSGGSYLYFTPYSIVYNAGFTIKTN